MYFFVFYPSTYILQLFRFHSFCLDNIFIHFLYFLLVVNMCGCLHVQTVPLHPFSLWVLLKSISVISLWRLQTFNRKLLKYLCLPGRADWGCKIYTPELHHGKCMSWCFGGLTNIRGWDISSSSSSLTLTTLSHFSFLIKHNFALVTHWVRSPNKPLLHSPQFVCTENKNSCHWKTHGWHLGRTSLACVRLYDVWCHQWHHHCETRHRGIGLTYGASVVIGITGQGTLWLSFFIEHTQNCNTCQRNKSHRFRLKHSFAKWNPVCEWAPALLPSVCNI